MKTILTFVLLALPTSSAWAFERPQMGSACGLTDDYGSDSWKEAPGHIRLDSATEDDVHALDTLTKQQLIIAAKIVVSDSSETHRQIRNTWDAVLTLREWSEGEDLYVSHFKFQGRAYTQVQFYPGGNPGGVIFVRGTRHAVARISDSDVVCLE